MQAQIIEKRQANFFARDDLTAEEINERWRQHSQERVLLTDAARDGDTVTVRTLLSAADAQSLMNYQDENGSSPLHLAAENGHASVTAQLIEARCNVDLQDENGATPLHIAAENGHASVTEQLIEARCNVNLQD